MNSKPTTAEIVALCLLSLIMLTREPAIAQTAGSFSELRLRLAPGDSVRVTDDGGRQLSGRISAISDSSLRLTGRDALELRESDVREIQRFEPDSVWNGTLIGAGAGLGAGLIATLISCGTDDNECGFYAGLAFIPAGTAIGAVVGALIDRGIRNLQTVYLRPGSRATTSLSLDPILFGERKGIRLQFNF